jgi:tRNA(Phe) wybutosine-synthesizing methylase Tyw3
MSATSFDSAFPTPKAEMNAIDSKTHRFVRDLALWVFMSILHRCNQSNNIYTRHSCRTMTSISDRRDSADRQGQRALRRFAQPNIAA